MSKRTKGTARTVKAEFVDCRTFQHAWRPYDVHLDGNTYIQELICGRCKTTKAFRINKFNGQVVGAPRYSYAEGYVIPGGRMTAEERGSLRLISVRSTPTSVAGRRRRGGAA